MTQRDKLLIQQSKAERVVKNAETRTLLAKQALGRAEKNRKEVEAKLQILAASIATMAGIAAVACFGPGGLLLSASVLLGGTSLAAYTLTLDRVIAKANNATVKARKEVVRSKLLAQKAVDGEEESRRTWQKISNDLASMATYGVVTGRAPVLTGSEITFNQLSSLADDMEKISNESEVINNNTESAGNEQNPLLNIITGITIGALGYRLLQRNSR